MSILSFIVGYPSKVHFTSKVAWNIKWYDTICLKFKINNNIVLHFWYWKKNLDDPYIRSTKSLKRLNDSVDCLKI